MSADRRVKEPAQRIPGNRAAQAGRPDCARVGESEAAGAGPAAGPRLRLVRGRATHAHFGSARSSSSARV